ncbi:MAG: glucose-6-phosphate isomerase [Patescibacteria group bacterium]|nr:glucose-6-phosphate isomerase [Patescibacteria group bacterium]
MHLTYLDANMRADLSATEKISPQVLREAHEAVVQLHEEKEQGWLDVLDDAEYLQSINSAVKQFSKYKNCLVIGIGGSDLGTRALLEALQRATCDVRRATTLWFSGDTTDPEAIAAVLDEIPWKQTCINIISKSGGTLETMSVFFEAKRRLEKAVGAKQAAARIICTTDSEKGTLREMAQGKGYATLTVPENIGGRFSVLTAVGLFPLALAGVNTKDLLKGAIEMRDDWLEAPGASHPADRFAAWQAAHEMRKHRNIHVLFTYASYLRGISNWWRQLWAESLGKAQLLNGRPNVYGPTPVASIGPTDQHSQMQLYHEGPDNKIFTFITVDNLRAKLKVPTSAKNYELTAYMSGLSFAELLNAEATGSIQALAEADRPVGQIKLNKIDAQALGSLICFFEIATAVAGQLYGINAFDQPGVEASKKKTKEILAKI